MLFFLPCFCLAFHYEYHLGTQSAYPNENQWQPVPLPLKQVQLIHRHGARLPVDVKEMIELEEFLHQYSDEFIIPSLQNFVLPFNTSEEGQLTEMGAIQLKSSGHMAVEKYKPLLQLETSHVSSTVVKRVLESAKAFLSSVWPDQSVPIHTQPIDQDADLRPHDACKAWQNTPTDYSQVQAFKQRAFSNTARRLTKASGLTSAEFTVDQIVSLFEVCSYTISLYDASPNQGICSLFTKKDFINYQIYGDLTEYYMWGYAKDINSKMLCSTVTSIVRGISSPFTSILRFTHAEVLIPLMTTLGLFNDHKHLTADMSDFELYRRRWSASKFSVFAARIWIEVYDEYLRFIIDGVPTAIPNCQSHPKYPELCLIDSFTDIYKDLIGCNFDALCQNQRHAMGSWQQ